VICDLCREDSDKIVRIKAWTVCQWCVTNNVVDRALDEESALAYLTDSVAKASAAHQRDVMDETVAASEVESAYRNLTAALAELAATSAHSKESLRIALAAQEAYEAFKARENRKVLGRG